MRYTRHLVTLRTFGLAFAVVLSPALMQASDMTCGQGDTRLAVLELEVTGENLIAFDMNQRLYEVALPESAESAVLRAQSVDPAAEVMYNLSGACPPPIASGNLPTGGGEVTIEDLAFGHSTLAVWVHAPEDKADCYIVQITQPMLCE